MRRPNQAALVVAACAAAALIAPIATASPQDADTTSGPATASTPTSDMTKPSTTTSKPTKTKPTKTSPTTSAPTTSTASPTTTPTSTPPGPHDETSAEEKKRVDGIKITLDFKDKVCEVAQCTDVQLPLNYDDPNGAKTRVRVARMPSSSKNKVGTLFMNPGGPGGSAIGMIEYGRLYFPADLLDRFDIVAVEPRGGNQSDQVHCFPSTAERAKIMGAMKTAFPYTDADAARLKPIYERFGEACSTTGQPFVGRVSTADHARDIEVVRRTLGTEKLNFLGFSYGSVIGQTYAAMFPDRVRAIANDGVVDIGDWYGEPGASEWAFERFGVADQATKDITTFLTMCQQAGSKKCVFNNGDTKARYEKLIQKIKKKPVKYGENTLDYPEFMAWMFKSLYSDDAPLRLSRSLDGVDKAAKGQLSEREGEQLLAQLKAHTSANAVGHQVGDDDKEAQYDHIESNVAVTCSEVPMKRGYDSYVAKGKELRTSPYIGEYLVHGWDECVNWSTMAPLRYQGPLNRTPATPMLFIGADWDPATPPAGALKATKRSPGAKMILADNWGHTSFTSNKCTAALVIAYLSKLELPNPQVTRCEDKKDPWKDYDTLAKMPTYSILP